MCGIAGIISKKNSVMHIDDINHMLSAQRHRGPDDFGIACYDYGNKSFSFGKRTEELESLLGFNGVIGHNRLSILDLSDAGHQPMMSSDASVAIVYNGEIYNAPELKDELRKSGYSFKSETDTEVILNYYIKYGIDETVRKLNGMFAFCIVDLSKEKTFLVRDRVGIKPLYYTEKQDEIVFASEIKSIIKRTDIKKIIDLDAVEEYFTFRSCMSDSLIKGIVQVKPGEYIQIGKDGTVCKKKWFNLNEYKRESKKVGDFETIISKAVNRQMISDVKVGCQLSGGIDSSLISYFAKKTGYEDAVSIVFADKEYSEEQYIDYVTDRLNIKSHKKILDIDYFLKNWERMNWHMDTIVNHPNTMGIMALAEESKKYVTVLLSGEGADETAGGYENFTISYLVSRFVNKKGLVANFIRSRYKNYFKMYKEDCNEFVLRLHGFTKTEMTEKYLLKQPQKKRLHERYERICSLEGSDFERLIKYDIEFYLPELLMRQDKMTMASSIENRVPFLDNEMIDFFLNCDEQQLIGRKKPDRFSLSKDNFVVGKKILKKLCCKIYGRGFTYRKKCGFSMPIRDFFLDKRFVNYVNGQLLPSMKERGIINAEYVRKNLYNVEALSQADVELLWRALSFETWCQLFIDGRNVIEIA